VVARTRGKIAAHAAFMILLFAYVGFHAAHWSPAYAGVDDNGYWRQGSSLALHGDSRFKLESPLQYVHRSYTGDSDAGYFRSKYPPGFPLLIATGMKAFGHHAALTIPLLLSSALLVGCYKLTQATCSNPIAPLVATLLLAASPVFNVRTDQGDAHLFSAALFVWGSSLLYAPASSQSRWRAVLAGLFLGSIPAVRYLDSLLIPAVIVGILSWREAGLVRFERLAWAAVGASVSLLFFAAWSWETWGAPWATGYAGSGEHSGFFGAWTLRHFTQYISYLPSFGFGAAFILGIVGALTMCRHRKQIHLGTCLFASTGTLLIVCSGYYWGPPTDPQITLRFLFPLLPLYCVAAACLLDQLFHDISQRAFLWAALLVCTVQGIASAPSVMASTSVAGLAKQIMSTAHEGAKKAIPAGSLVVADDQLLQFFDYEQTWKLVSARAIAPGLRDTFTGMPLPFPFQPGRDDKRVAVFRAATGDTRMWLLAKELKRWGGSQFYYLAPVGSEPLDYRLTTHCQNVLTIPLPKAPDFPAPESVFGANMIPRRKSPRNALPWHEEFESRLPIGVHIQADLSRLDPARPLLVQRCTLRL